MFQTDYSKSAQTIQSTVAAAMNILDQNSIYLTSPKPNRLFLYDGAISPLWKKSRSSSLENKLLYIHSLSVPSLAVNYTVSIVVGEGNMYRSADEAYKQTSSALRAQGTQLETHRSNLYVYCPRRLLSAHC